MFGAAYLPTELSRDASSAWRSQRILRPLGVVAGAHDYSRPWCGVLNG